MKSARIPAAMAVGLGLVLPIRGLTGQASAASSIGQCESASAPTVSPPVGFNPTAASAAELTCYGFPSRPSNNPQALASWTNAMEHFRFFAAAHEVRTVNGKAPPNASICCDAYGGSWAGYYASQQNNSWMEAFTEVNMQWNVPYANSQDNYYTYVWPGLGGNDIVQAGTGTLDSTVGSYQYFFWYEDLPGSIQVVSSSQLVPTPGQSVYVDVNWHAGQQSATYYFENLYTGASWSTTQAVAYPPSPVQADFMLEDPNAGVSNATSGYTNSGTVTVSNCTAAGLDVNYASQSYTLYQLNDTDFIMVDAYGNSHSTQSSISTGASFWVSSHS